MIKKTISSQEYNNLLRVLKDRFENNKNRHEKLDRSKIQAKLEVNSQKLWSLHKMEETGGEPDVIDYDSKTDEYIFVDCSVESPKGRRSLCYDDQALKSRKENKPKDSAINLAQDIGIEILTEKQYRDLQQLGEFDLKTSSWIQTPIEIRKLGGALFADRRYDNIFVYHNGAESYYAARGFRGTLRA